MLTQEIAEQACVDDLCNRLGELDVLLEQLPPYSPRRIAAEHEQEILRSRIDMLMDGCTGDLPMPVIETYPMAA